ncbi:hypothetical protein C472_00484 [Halorubrum tebenquichense DSM 14210]|uniref:Holin n=2 Tax=Halorubrum tebenquichense TaxID=119434 RepID=M0E696_9EURY|nr:hypothetical protein C472_00484 [Halorubrum tebenquichense DSM 14210]
MASIEFAAFLAVFVPSFVFLSLLLEPLQMPTWAVLGLGMLFGEVTNRAVDWFTERYARRVGATEVADVE